MNWAIIAPESRIFKGKNLFRWDDSPGLEHHCGICATPLHNARAKTSCLGKHVEPCFRFHQQLHFVGKSHECHGCNNSDRMHYTRHKEILQIVRQIKSFDGTKLQIPGADASSRQESRESLSMSGATSTSDASWDTCSNGGAKTTKRERKKAKKIGKVGAVGKYGSAVMPAEELGFISQAIHERVHESKGAWEGTYAYSRSCNEEISTGVIDTIEEVLSETDASSVKPPATRTPRQRKVHKTLFTPPTLRGDSRKFTPPSKTNIDPYHGVDPKIFYRLGVSLTHPQQNSIARKALIARLVAAVKEDLEIMSREDEDSALREEAFSRWVGKTAIDQIRRTREDLDWATGQRRGYPSEECNVNDAEKSEHMDINPLPAVAEPTRKPLDTITKLHQNKELMAAKIPSKAPRKMIEVAPKLVDGVLSVQQAEDDDQDGWSVVTRARGLKKQQRRRP